MNTIEELIQKECPEGVEFKTLGDICEIETGSSNTNEGITGGLYPFYTRGQEVLTKNEYEYDDCSIITSGDGVGVGKVFHFTNGKYALHQRAYRIHVVNEKNIDSKFLYYYFRNNFLSYISMNSFFGSVTSVRKPMLIKYPIPIPPLSVQHKIVEILDKFTSLEAELQEELEARKKQYEYYRNQLLDFTGREDVEWKTLPDISTNYDSQRKPIKSSHRESGQFPYYGASGIVDYVDGYIFDGDFLLISEDGANLLARSTKIAFSISGKNWVNNHAHVLKFKDDNLRKFVEYFVEHLDLTQYISAGAQPKLTKDKLNKIPIPLPNEEEIHRIVTILDKFEALLNGQTASLSAEIKARHQQYEYYRDKLLTFQRKEA